MRRSVLPLLSYGLEIMSVTLRKERKIRVTENGVLRKVLGRKREDIIGKYGKLHNDLCSSSNIVQ